MQAGKSLECGALDGSEVRARLTGSSESRAPLLPVIRKELSDLHGAAEDSMDELRRSLRMMKEDFDLVATAYAIHRTVGGNLAEILDNIAYTIRERVRIKGEIATLTAQARASGTLITFLPIVLATFMFFVTPTYFRPMTKQFLGWVMLGAAAVLILIGNLIINKIVKIKV